MTQDRTGAPQPFVKMHGLGNDFVVLDARERPVRLGAAQIRALADRRVGIGFDQMVTLEPSNTADVFMRIHNADGGEVDACGNAARCVAALLMAENNTGTAVIDSGGGVLTARDAGAGLISVDMGPARTDWREIPLAREMDTLHLDLAADGLADPVGVGMGNPHAVFFVEDTAAVDLATIGPRLEHDPLFPARANIGIAHVRAGGGIRLRVWERGAGITRACGTAACAARVAAARRGLAPRAGPVELDGGVLEIDWREDGHVDMTGPAATSFAGTFDPAVLGA